MNMTHFEKSVFRHYDDLIFSQGLLSRQGEINAYTREAAFRPIRSRPTRYALNSNGSITADILLLRNLRSQSDIFHTLRSPITARPITYITRPQRSDTPSNKCDPKRVTREMKFLVRASQEIGPDTKIIVLMMPSREKVAEATTIRTTFAIIHIFPRQRMPASQLSICLR